MLETTLYYFQSNIDRPDHFSQEYEVSAGARRLFQRSRQQGWIAGLVAACTGRRTQRDLVALSDFTGGRANLTRHQFGIRSVRLSEIRGSVGRCHDFDVDFHPLAANIEQRWLRVATARQGGLGLPVVQLIDVNGVYFVQDGHHRVSVARARGECEIDAEVMTLDLA